MSSKAVKNIDKEFVYFERRYNTRPTCICFCLLTRLFLLLAVIKSDVSNELGSTKSRNKNVRISEINWSKSIRFYNRPLKKCLYIFIDST